MQKILIPVDFSETAANAAEFAGNLAIFYNAQIYLYHSYEIPVGIAEYPFPILNVNEMQEAADNELNLFKETLLKKLRSKVEIHTKTDMNVFILGLEELCAEVKPDLVIMGLSGSGALTRLIVGSNTIKAVHELKCPVLVIPPKASFRPVLKIGFACDYKQVQETTPLSMLLTILKDFNASLYIVNVDFEDRDFTVEKMEESFAVRRLFEDIKPLYKSIEAENVTDGINKFTENEELDWIAVIPKKHTLVQKIFNRSHSTDLLFHTSVPILCIHQ